MAELFIGIEGVSMRYSGAVMADEKGRVLSSYWRPDPLSLHTTNSDDLREGLIRLLYGLARNASLRYGDLDGSRICIGLTGVTFPFDAEVHLPSEFAYTDIKPSELACTGDAEIVFASHIREHSGAVIICHMGSTVDLVHDGVHRRFGGWGPLTGDEGSGYWIGQQCLRAIAREHDTRAEPSRLWTCVDEWLRNPTKHVLTWRNAARRWSRIRRELKGNRDPRQAIFAFLYELSRLSLWDSRCVVSGLTFPVDEAASQGDQVAAAIIDEAARALAALYVTAAKIGPRPSIEGPLVLFGAVPRHIKRYRDRFLAEIADARPADLPAPIAAKTLQPAFGALLYALGGSRTNALRLPDTHVVARVAEQAALAAIDVSSNA